MTCPTGNGIVDFLGYGTSNCFEGTVLGAESATKVAVRNGGGCTDTNNNASDFTLATASLGSLPHNSASATNNCSATSSTRNESDTAAELNYCAIQPAGAVFDIETTAGSATRSIYTQVYEATVTDVGDNRNAGAIKAQIGFGPVSANPEWQSGWTWVDATFNVVAGNNYEYTATLSPPATGTFAYATRFSLDAGPTFTWTYCDKNGAGSNANLTFETTQIPLLIVDPVTP
jgi:hypothetical protein